MARRPFKNLVLKPGFYTLTSPGEKCKGFDMSKFVRDVMNQCGYICYSCDPNEACYDKNVFSPMFAMEKKIKELEERLAELESNQ